VIKECLKSARLPTLSLVEGVEGGPTKALLENSKKIKVKIIKG